MPDFNTIDASFNQLGSRRDTVVLFKVGGTYYARKYDGTLLSASTTAETVIAAALSNKGVIYFAHAGAETGSHTGQTLWDLSGSFTGFTIPDSTTLIADSYFTQIRVPNGFTGNCFTINGTTSIDPDNSVRIKGIEIEEQGSAARNWTGVKCQIENGEQLEFTEIDALKVYNCGTGLELETTGTGFINANRFNDITVSVCRVGFLIDLTGGNQNGNLFTNCGVQALAGTTTNGFKDIDGNSNTFVGCNVWDIDTDAVEANIKSTARGTTIIGGKMTGEKGFFLDAGTRTTIIADSSVTGARYTFMSLPDTGNYGAWYGHSPLAADGILNGKLSAIKVGTGTDGAETLDSTGGYNTFDTAGTINSLSGIRYTTQTMTRRILNPYFKAGIYLNNNTNMRVFAGLVASGSAPASSADPLNALEGIGLWFDSGVSANWKIMHNDNVGASTVDDTGVTASTGSLKPIELIGSGDTKFRYIFNNSGTSVSTNIPASTTNLGFWVYIENTTAASRTMRCYYIIGKSDK